MRIKIIIISIMMFLGTFMLSGCEGRNNIEEKEEEKLEEKREDESEEDINENREIKENVDEKIQYYEDLDNHTQVLFDAFISYDWKSIDSLLEEFKMQDEEKCAVYDTPLKNYSLVIEYIPEMRSWQAYLGEFSEGKKEGKGVMVSKRRQGYSDTNVYIGAWSNNMPNGEGVLSDWIGDMEHVFAGTFVDGKFDGNIQVYKLITPDLYVDWEIIEPLYYEDVEWSYANLTFDKGTPIPSTIDVVDQYIAVSGLSEHETKWMELESDGQAYYRIYNDAYNYILSMGAKAPADGYRGSICAIYGKLFDYEGNAACYGVACYATNRLD